MSIKSQQDQREWFSFTDQHGRAWGANVEIKSKGTVGMVKPQGWDAPFPEWMPAQKYVKQVPGRDMLVKVQIDYDRWIGDLREAWRDRDTLVQQIVTSLPGATMDAVTGALNPIARAAVGHDPMPIAPVVAMQKGNFYALGLKDAAGNYYPVDERLREYFPVRGPASKHAEFPDFSGAAPVASEPEPAVFACEDCGREFTRKAALASHQRTHVLAEA